MRCVFVMKYYPKKLAHGLNRGLAFFCLLLKTILHHAFLWNNILTVINALLRFYEKDDRSYGTIFQLWWRWICSFMGKMGCPMEQYLN